MRVCSVGVCGCVGGGMLLCVVVVGWENAGMCDVCGGGLARVCGLARGLVP